jgi:hypothetical protein
MTGGERRDVTTRALRNAVAGWFGIHPSCLAPLDQLTVQRMELRLEGQRLRPALDVRLAPWACDGGTGVRGADTATGDRLCRRGGHLGAVRGRPSGGPLLPDLHEAWDLHVHVPRFIREWRGSSR